MKTGMRKSSAILFFTLSLWIASSASATPPHRVFSSTYSPSETVIAEGEMLPIHFSVRTQGHVRILHDAATGEDRIEFGNDFEMSSGVVLDIKTCGPIDAEQPELRVCLSQAELRQLRGAHFVPIRFKLGRYDQVKIFDLDLVLDHAGATLHAPASPTP